MLTELSPILAARLLLKIQISYKLNVNISRIPAII